MSEVVIDASFTLATLFEDERMPAVMAIRTRIAADGALVPGLWWLEVANSLLVAERRRRVTREHRLGSLADLATLPITTDPETAGRAWSDTLALAEVHRASPSTMRPTLSWPCAGDCRWRRSTRNFAWRRMLAASRSSEVSA